MDNQVKKLTLKVQKLEQEITTLKERLKKLESKPDPLQPFGPTIK